MENIKTNADAIRNMSDEELNKFLHKITENPSYIIDTVCKACPYRDNGGCSSNSMCITEGQDDIFVFLRTQYKGEM